MGKLLKKIGAQASLGTLTKLPSGQAGSGSTIPAWKTKIRRERWKLLRDSKKGVKNFLKKNFSEEEKILAEKKHGRILSCADHLSVRRTADGKIQQRSGVDVVLSHEHGTASYHGLAMCGSVWACPVCSAKIKARRGQEIALAFDKWLSGKGSRDHHVAMLTLTHAHSREDSLAENIRRHNEAKGDGLFAGRSWQYFKQKYGVDHYVTGSEITWGKENGWHYHQHILLFYSGKPEEMAKAKEEIVEEWISDCARAGFAIDEKTADDMREHSVDLMAECHSSDYLVKIEAGNWGADREVGGSDAKVAKGGRYTPFALAAAGRWDLFLEYLDATKGRHFLHWSRGFKAFFGIAEKSDAELAEESQDNGTTIAVIPRRTWDIVVKRKLQVLLLEVAEAGGVEALFAFAENEGLRLVRPAPLL